METLQTKIDVAGKTYGLELTDYTARKLQPLGFDAYNFISDESMAVVFGLSPVLADVLVCLCEPSDEDAFRRGLTGDVMEAAREALKNAVVNFTPAASRSNVLSVFSEMAKAIQEMATTVPELTSSSAS